MTQRTCSTDGCERPHLARGMCSSHYSTWHRHTHGRKPAAHQRICVACGESFSSSILTGQYCSELCFVFTRNGAQSCRWPRPSRRAAAPKPPPFREDRQCEWCEADFTASVANQRFCSPRHKIRAKRNRRRGQQYGSTSHFTWAEVMRLFLRFDRACAYCETPIDGMPDPDHVLALSRGGSNSITNILPCCSLCNSDKRELTLTEWAIDRARRGLPTRNTTWAIDDPRIVHLTVLDRAA